MTAHKHAALMLQYAQDATETDEPWKRWESAASSNKWGPLYEHPRWVSTRYYRRKPRTMTYTVTILEPLRKAPEVGSIFYVPTPLSDGLTSMCGWHGGELDYRLLKRGLCFATQEGALAAAKAMMPIKGEEL